MNVLSMQQVQGNFKMPDAIEEPGTTPADEQQGAAQEPVESQVSTLETAAPLEPSQQLDSGYESITKLLSDAGIDPAQRGWNDDQAAFQGLLQAERDRQRLTTESEQYRNQLYYLQQQQQSAAQAAQQRAYQEQQAAQQQVVQQEFKPFFDAIDLKEADPKQYLRRNRDTGQSELIPGTEQLYEKAMQTQQRANEQWHRIVQDPKGFYQSVYDHVERNMAPRIGQHMQQALAQHGEQIMRAVQAQAFVNSNRQAWLDPSNNQKLTPEGEMAYQLAQEARNYGVPEQNIVSYVQNQLARHKTEAPAQIVQQAARQPPVQRNRISNGALRQTSRAGTLAAAAGRRPVTQNDALSIDQLFDQTIKEVGGVQDNPN